MENVFYHVPGFEIANNVSTMYYVILYKQSE